LFGTTKSPIDSDKIGILMQNVNQMLEIIKATTGLQSSELSPASDTCMATTSDTEELACAYPEMVATAWKAAKDGDMNLSFSIMAKVRTCCSANPRSMLSGFSGCEPRKMS
jgi:hypothetical protein